jgi:hypothetical protein
MKRPIRILLQATIPKSEDDWTIERFSLLRDYLASLKDEAENPLCEVTARNRESNEDDPVLSNLNRSNFDELWLFAVVRALLMNLLVMALRKSHALWKISRLMCVT